MWEREEEQTGMMLLPIRCLISQDLSSMAAFTEGSESSQKKNTGFGTLYDLPFEA